MRTTNLVLRFLLELFALAALGYWGATRPAAALGRVALGAGAPLLAAVFWGVFVAPRARVVLPTAARMALGLVVFGAAAAALVTQGHVRIAAAFGALAVANVALMVVWSQDRIVPRDAP